MDDEGIQMPEILFLSVKSVAAYRGLMVANIYFCQGDEEGRVFIKHIIG